MEERTPTQTAPYGHACMHCFKSKCKCVRRPNGDGCERCHRLRKECVRADSRRRRHARQQDSAEKIIELEGKLDRLAGILESVARSPGISPSLVTALNNEKELAGSRERSGSSQQQQQQQQKDPPNVDPATVSSSSSGAVFFDAGSLSTASDTPATSSGQDLIFEATASAPAAAVRPSPGVSRSYVTSPPYLCDPSPHDADTSLDIFRSRFLPFFPVIHLVPEVTAQHLLADRPVLMRAIMTVATPSTERKLARGAELKRILAHATLLENQSNIDVLLGLLVFIAWGNDQVLNKVGNRKMGNLSRPMVLAMSIVSELRWNKPHAPINYMATSLPIQSPILVCDEQQQQQQQRGGDQVSLEIQRAVLGCFILSSFISSYFEQSEPMQFTPHMEGYLRNLEQNPECPEDKILSGQVRLQLLAQSVAQVQGRHDEHNTIESAAGPESFFFNTAQAQLQTLQTSLGPHLLQEDILAAHIHYVELTILETFYPITSSISSSRHGMTLVTSMKCAEFAWRTLAATQSFFDVFFARSSRWPASCVGISFTFWAQLSKSLVVLFRLSTMSDWNEEKGATKAVDLLAVLDRLSGTMEQAGVEAGERSADDLYAQIARLLRTFRQWVGEKKNKSRGASGAKGQVETGGNTTNNNDHNTRPAGDAQQQRTWFGSAPQVDETMLDSQSDAAMMMMQAVDFENEEWFRAFFGPT